MRLLIAGFLALIAAWRWPVPAALRPSAARIGRPPRPAWPRYGDGWNSIAVPREADGQFVVAGMVNGAEVTFLVDSGASEIVLSPADARRGSATAPVQLRFTRTASTANGSGAAGAGAPCASCASASSAGAASTPW